MDPRLMRTELKHIADFVRKKDGVFIADGANVHMGIFTEPYISRIYAGQKTLESRITRNRIAPYGKISKGDAVLVKRSSGPVEAIFTAGNVWEYDLARTSLSEIRQMHGEGICAGDDFWQQKSGCRYAVIIEITGLVRFEPVWVEKRGQATWVLLEHGQD